MGCRIPYDGHDENGEQQVNPRAGSVNRPGGVRPVNEGIREERQVCDAGEDRADGEQDTERLPEGKITDPMEEYCKQDKGRQDPESLGIPKSAQTRPPAKAQRSESGIPVRKKVQWFSTKPVLDRKKAERTAQGTMEKNSRKYRMTRDQNGLFILNILLSFLYGPL